MLMLTLAFIWLAAAILFQIGVIRAVRAWGHPVDGRCR
jgi:hypothetical protein